MGAGGPQGSGRTNAGGHKKHPAPRVVHGGGPYGGGSTPSPRRRQQTSRAVARTPVKRYVRPKQRVSSHTKEHVAATPHRVKVQERAIQVGQRQKKVEANYQRMRKKYLARAQFFNAARLGGHGRGSFFVDPHVLADSNFKGVAKEMWPKLGLGGKQPKLIFDKKDDSGAWAYVTSKDKNAIHITPSLALSAQFNPKRRGPGYGTFAHEAAHTRQKIPGRYPANKKLVEGGADAFAESRGSKALRSTGLAKRYRGGPAYKGFTRSARKKGKKWVLKGQFGK